MDSKIETMVYTEYVYMRRTGEYGKGNAVLMESFKAWLRSQNMLADASVILGIARDDPGITAAENCRYDVCLLTAADGRCFAGTLDTVSGNRIEYGTMSGGTYAVFIIEHTACAVEQAWNILPAALAERKLTVDHSRPILERYACAMVRNHLCEICVPVQPAG
jgi:DNA gyrase inhibitor GyrI